MGYGYYVSEAKRRSYLATVEAEIAQYDRLIKLAEFLPKTPEEVEKIEYVSWLAISTPEHAAAFGVSVLEAVCLAHCDEFYPAWIEAIFSGDSDLFTIKPGRSAPHGWRAIGAAATARIEREYGEAALTLETVKHFRKRSVRSRGYERRKLAAITVA